MVKKNRFFKGFTFLELAVVFVVASVMIVVNISAKVFIQQSKINRTLGYTSTSQVTEVEGLALWIEATTPNAVDGRVGDNISRWYSTGQNIINYSQITVSSQPELAYHNKGFYMLEFDGDDSLSLEQAINCNSCTAFFVFNYDAIISNNNSFVFYNGDVLNDGWGLSIGGITSDGDENNTFTIRSGGGVSKVSNSILVRSEAVNIVTYIYDARSSNTILRRNQQDLTLTNSSGSSNTPSAESYIGSDDGNGACLQGGIAEIIIYSRPLRQKDYEKIEEYLMTKYQLN